MPFTIDMHTHTTEGSACASQSVEELIARAEAFGLDGVAITDHNSIEGALKGHRLARRRGIKVFMGVEIATEEIGDVLVYGLRENIPDGLISLRRLARLAEKAGAVMFAAHPFRRHTVSAMWSYFEELRYDWRRAFELPEVVSVLDGVEVVNGGCTPQENEAATAFAARFRLPGIAGSDAHGQWRVGWCATEFETHIENDRQLVEALRSRRFRVARHHSEFASERERRSHLRSMSTLRGRDLRDYVEEWMRRKPPPKP